MFVINSVVTLKKQRTGIENPGVFHPSVLFGRPSFVSLTKKVTVSVFKDPKSVRQ